MGLSVSRVGGKAQNKSMRQVASKLRLDLAQYRELVTFAQFGMELDKATQQQLVRGERMVEILKQPQYEPLPIARQVIIIFAGAHGHLDDIEISRVKRFEKELYAYLEKQYPEIEKEIEAKKELSPEFEDKLNKGIAEFKLKFNA